MWIPELGLSNNDHERLLSDGWVTDSIVNAAQTLLRESNPNILGLQNVALGLTMSFDVEPGEFAQILHNGSGHWIAISAVGTKHPNVEVFDSVYSMCPLECKAQVATLLATEYSSFQLKYMNVQMQAGGNDCDIFAIAFTTALVFAEQPVNFSFKIINQPEMCKRLHECFIKRQMSMFPVKRSRHSQVSVKRTEEVPVYCTCQIPELPGLQ